MRKATTVDISALVDTMQRRPKASNVVPVKTPQPSQTRGPEEGHARYALSDPQDQEQNKWWFYTTAPDVVGYIAPGGREGRGAAWPAVQLGPGSSGRQPPRGLAVAGRSSSVFGEGGVAYQAGETVAMPYDSKNCFPKK